MSTDATKCGREVWPELETLAPLEGDDVPLLPLVPECDRPTHGDAGRRGVVVA